MTSVKVKFSPSSVILKEGTVHYQIIHHCKVRHIRTGYKLFPSEWISASGEINVSAGSGEGRHRICPDLDFRGSTGRDSGGKEKTTETPALLRERQNKEAAPKGGMQVLLQEPAEGT